MSTHTRAAVARRVDIVYKMLLDGLDRREIIDAVREQYPKWQSSSRTIDRYIAKAKVLIEEAGRYERPVEHGRLVARLHEVYRAARAKGDERTALAVLKEFRELFGLGATPAVNVNHSGSLEFITPDAVEAEIARLEAQFAASE